MASTDRAQALPLRIARRFFVIGFIVTAIGLPFVVVQSIRATNERLIERNAVEVSIAAEALRDYYAERIVGRVQSAPGPVVLSERYHEIPGAIPIPATFSIEIGDVLDLSHDDVSFEYYFVSDYPFANRDRPPLSPFQRDALEAFRSDPELTEFVQRRGRAIVGQQSYAYAVPVVMAASCVTCHNTHPDSSFRDWKVGDVRGVQAVEVTSLAPADLGSGFLYGYLTVFTWLAFASLGVLRATNRELEDVNLSLDESRERESDTAQALRDQVDRLELFEAIAERSTFGVAIADARAPDWPLVYVNDRFVDMTGYGRDEALGRNCRFMQGEDTDPRAIDGIREALADARAHTTEILNYRRDGTPFWNRLSVFPVGGVPGKPNYFVGYQADVTELRRAAQEREAMLVEVQEAQRSESLGILVAGVAHEVNTPLGVALTAATHAQEATRDLERELARLPSTPPAVEDALEDEREAVDMIVGNLNRAVELVQGFKDVAADRSGRSVREVDLASYLESVAATLRPLLRGAGVTLTLELEPDVLCTIDTGSFGQAITNLIVNATVHAFAGIERPEIRLTSTLDQGTVSVSVADNGIGISAAARPHLFTPFFTTRRAEGGTGLGLFIARRIARDELGGDLVLDPSERGTTFVLRFPLASEARS